MSGTQSNWQVKTSSWNQGSLLHYWPQEKGQLCHLVRFWLVPGFGPDFEAPAVSFPSVSVPVWHSQHGSSFMHAGAVRQTSCEMLGDLPGIPRRSCWYPGANCHQGTGKHVLIACWPGSGRSGGSTPQQVQHCVCTSVCVYDSPVFWSRPWTWLAPSFVLSLPSSLMPLEDLTYEMLFLSVYELWIFSNMNKFELNADMVNL